MPAPVLALLIALAGPADTIRIVADSAPIPDIVPVQAIGLVPVNFRLR